MIRTCWSVFKYSETSHQSLAVEAGKASCRITMITTTEMVAIKMANIATITAAVCRRVCVWCFAAGSWVLTARSWLRWDARSLEAIRWEKTIFQGWSTKYTSCTWTANLCKTIGSSGLVRRFGPFFDILLGSRQVVLPGFAATAFRLFHPINGRLSRRG